ncbi:hypothetical protein ABT124_18790 [Streptomyces sp. NPDC001982]|uniref:hypothetical protein n=1 Tax=Streptomyces sp. NPDC001982 TaxID=3154405 RepID=UPI00332B3374
MEQSGGTARPAVAVTGMRCLIDLDGAGRFGWRLVASNGRAVAVSVASYASHARCRAAFLWLCGEHADMAGGIQGRRPPASG